MIIKINGHELAAAETSVAVPAVLIDEMILKQIDSEIGKNNGVLDTIAKWLVPAFLGAEALAKYGVQKAAAAAVTVKASAAFKASGVAVAALAATAKGGVSMWSRLEPLVHLVQDLAMPVGIIVATWGLIELMLGNPAGKQRIKLAVVCYAGMFLIPTLFQEIHRAFRGV